MQQTENLNLNLIESTDPVDWTPLNANMETIEAELGHIGHNLRVETGSYVGTGDYGEASPSTLTFDLYPVVIMLVSHTTVYASPPCIMMRPQPVGVHVSGSEGALAIRLTWDDHGVTWYATRSAFAQANEKDVTYEILAFGF